MADTYEVVGALATQRLINGVTIEDVMEVTAVSKPNGVTFTVEVPKTAGWVQAAASKLAAEAAEMESVFGL
jgi:hypothetical protein